jgi:phosphoribosyl-ATP pyrophosphohydrolase/phosphoribosyl-AMP cyclohydrolase
MRLDEIARLDWDKADGLLPAVVQHAHSGAVLMLGYMSREALRATLESARVTFYSRSRRKLWTKGETSGNHLETVAVSSDCDHDALLVQALPAGPVCHSGAAKCFPEAITGDGESLAFLGQLERVIAGRFAARPDSSYTAKLQAEGPTRMAQKVGEEAVELALAAVVGGNAEVLAETADLLYHVTVLLQQRGIALADVIRELESRHAATR